MIEIHPFGEFIPKNSRYFLLGSFTTKPNVGYEWFYANGRNQFWPILEKVYERRLNTKEKQQILFEDLGMALADIIYSCERVNNSNLDNNLTNITYNETGVRKIFEKAEIERIYFTSRFVESTFRKIFKYLIHKDLELIYLPSPSPRNAGLRIEEKINIYKSLLP